VKESKQSFFFFCFLKVKQSFGSQNLNIFESFYPETFNKKKKKKKIINTLFVSEVVDRGCESYHFFFSFSFLIKLYPLKSATSRS
jgi:hypothetical protein